MVDHFRPFRDFHGTVIGGWKERCRLFHALALIVQAEEETIQAVMLVMVSRFDVTDALQAFVVRVYRLMVHVKRR